MLIAFDYQVWSGFIAVRCMSPFCYLSVCVLEYPVELVLGAFCDSLFWTRRCALLQGFWMDFIEYGDTYDFFCDVSLFNYGNCFLVALNIARFEALLLFFLLDFLIGMKIGGSAGLPPICGTVPPPAFEYVSSTSEWNVCVFPPSILRSLMPPTELLAPR